MQATMMNAWASFAKSGIPNTGKKNSWKKFNSIERSFMKLDRDDFLEMQQDMLSIEYILGNIQSSPAGSLLEKCMLARETIENIGDPLESEYRQWNQGACNQFDINMEKQKIEDLLIAEYGSVSVYGD